MTNQYLKAMAVGAKLKNNKMLYDMTDKWYGSEQCRIFTQIMVNAIDFKNNACTVEDLMYAIIDGINNIEISQYNDYARGYIAGERIGVPTNKNKKIVYEIENIWSKDNGEKWGYYQELVNEVIKNG